MKKQMNRLFGTDGIRAIAGKFPLDYASAYILGKALVGLLEKHGFSPQILTGYDTRNSGVWLEQALLQGIKASQGISVSAGVIPTSAISYLTRKHPFSAGIIVSASHNSYEYNGIKIFASNGMKIPKTWELELESALFSKKNDIPPTDVSLLPDTSLAQEYLKFLKNHFSPGHLNRKTKIVLDCSNGSASPFAENIFLGLGAEVIAIHNTPDGKNINEKCGSLHPEELSQKVLETGADWGIAYDGDADRAIWVDEKGKILNGDHTLFVLAGYMKAKRKLKSNMAVATTMSNAGLEQALNKRGIKLFRTEVGDKYVLEQMLRLDANLGGEQSGHTILLDECPTGDGILTSIKMLEAMTVSSASLSEMVEEFKEFPQVLKNVKISRKEGFQNFPEIIETIEKIQKKLNNQGRLNVRYSGTEPVARIMIEGEDQKIIEGYADHIAEIITRCLN